MKHKWVSNACKTVATEHSCRPIPPTALTIKVWLLSSSLYSFPKQPCRRISKSRLGETDDAGQRQSADIILGCDLQQTFVYQSAKSHRTVSWPDAFQQPHSLSCMTVDDLFICPQAPAQHAVAATKKNSSKLELRSAKSNTRQWDSAHVRASGCIRVDTFTLSRIS
jgi:hypothetical protein